MGTDVLSLGGSVTMPKRQQLGWSVQKFWHRRQGGNPTLELFRVTTSKRHPHDNGYVMNDLKMLF